MDIRYHFGRDNEFDKMPHELRNKFMWELSQNTSIDFLMSYIHIRVILIREKCPEEESKNSSQQTAFLEALKFIN